MRLGIDNRRRLEMVWGFLTQTDPRKLTQAQ
jgi:hypothetical protein